MTTRIIKTVLHAWLAMSILAAPTPASGADSEDEAANVAPQTSLAAGSDPASPPAARKQKEKDPLIVEVMGLAIGFIAVVMGIGIGIIAIWTDFKKHQDLIAFCHQERMAALEKGLEPPPFPKGCFDGVNPKDEVSESAALRKGLKAGLMWLAIGIGLVTYLTLQSGPNFHPSISAIPIGIGIVYLICYVVERRRIQAQPGQPK